jgi:hypothetical protein
MNAYYNAVTILNIVMEIFDLKSVRLIVTATKKNARSYHVGVVITGATLYCSCKSEKHRIFRCGFTPLIKDPVCELDCEFGLSLGECFETILKYEFCAWYHNKFAGTSFSKFDLPDRSVSSSVSFLTRRTAFRVRSIVCSLVLWKTTSRKTGETALYK